MQKDFEAFIGQGEQTQGRSWRLAKGRTSWVCEKKKKKRKENECEEDCLLVFMCGEVLMGRVCGRIKHERILCNKCLWQNLWTFGSINCFSQIHRWICVKFELVLA